MVVYSSKDLNNETIPENDSCIGRSLRKGGMCSINMSWIADCVLDVQTEYGLK